MAVAGFTQDRTDTLRDVASTCGFGEASAFRRYQMQHSQLRHSELPPPFNRTVRHDHERLKPVLEDMLMSNDDIRRVEVITIMAPRR